MNLTASDFFNRFSPILKPLGLSEYEIRVFLTLLTSGPSDYRILVRESNVPAGKIYQVLSTLEAKGFVEVLQEKPKIFRATEPKKALRRRLRQLEDDFFELERKITEALLTLQLQYSLKHDVVQGIVREITVGNNSFAKGVQENLLKSTNQVLISTSRFDIKLHEEDLFKRLLERGVSIKMICSRVEDNDKDVLTHLIDLGVDIRFLDGLGDRYYVVDDKCVSIFSGTFGEDICLEIHGPALCRLLRERFQDAWNRATALGLKSNNHKLN
jgi:sugar-specific transcriptional regulator TrmB